MEESKEREKRVKTVKKNEMKIPKVNRQTLEGSGREQWFR
jgi:hypothetical protein